MNKLSNRLSTYSYGGTHKITCPIQFSISEKNLMSDFNNHIILIVLQSRKAAEWALEWKDQAQCCATLDMGLFDFEDEILVYNGG